MTPLDARTLDAMRCVAQHGCVMEEGLMAIRAFLAAHDASTAAARDEELALAMINCTVVLPAARITSLDALQSPTIWRLRAQAARAHIAKEQQ